jgi:polyisoprenoid-binding protein YceI
MNHRKFISLSIAFLLFVLFNLHSQATYKLASHQIVVEGTSNLHTWSAEVVKASGDFAVNLEDNKLSAIDKLSLQIDASTLKSSEGNKMNSKIYEALNTKHHPSITFHLRQVNSITGNPSALKLNSSGVLTISGVSRTVRLNTTGKLLSNGDLSLTGTQVVKMSDHRISPPTAMLGALKTGDEVTIKYTIVLSPVKAISSVGK